MKRRKRTFRHLVSIEKQDIVGRDPSNKPIVDWVVFKKARAEIDPLRGREYLAGKQVLAEVTHRVSIRYIKGIKPTMRVRYKDRLFEIESVLNPYEKNYELQLMCKEQIS